MRFAGKRYGAVSRRRRQKAADILCLLPAGIVQRYIASSLQNHGLVFRCLSVPDDVEHDRSFRRGCRIPGLLIIS